MGKLDTEVSLLLPASSPAITVIPPLRRDRKPPFCLWAQAIDELRLMRPFAEMLWNFPTILLDLRSGDAQVHRLIVHLSPP